MAEEKSIENATLADFALGAAAAGTSRPVAGSMTPVPAAAGQHCTTSYVSKRHHSPHSILPIDIPFLVTLRNFQCPHPAQPF